MRWMNMCSVRVQHRNWLSLTIPKIWSSQNFKMGHVTQATPL